MKGKDIFCEIDSNSYNGHNDSPVICKIPYQEEGERERYEYVLTDKSRSLAPILFSMMDWGHKNILHDTPHVVLTDKESGDVLHSTFATEGGKIVDPKNVQITAFESKIKREF